MTFNKILKEELKTGIVGTVKWNKDEQSFQLSQAFIDIGLSAEDGSCWD